MNAEHKPALGGESPLSPLSPGAGASNMPDPLMDPAAYEDEIAKDYARTRAKREEGQERVVAAAIRMNDTALVCLLPSPARHSDVLGAAVRNGMNVLDRHEQGFFTSLGRFVRRGPARRIAKAAGQLIRKKPISKTFTSEELW